MVPRHRINTHRHQQSEQAQVIFPAPTGLDHRTPGGSVLLDMRSSDLLYSAPIPERRLVSTLSHAAAGGPMNYQVTLHEVAARPTAVVPATTTWQAFPTLWRDLSDEMWACLHAGGIDRDCRVIMLYWDEVPHVEVGVELLVPLSHQANKHAEGLLKHYEEVYDL